MKAKVDEAKKAYEAVLAETIVMPPLRMLEAQKAPEKPQVNQLADPEMAKPQVQQSQLAAPEMAKPQAPGKVKSSKKFSFFRLHR